MRCEGKKLAAFRGDPALGLAGPWFLIASVALAGLCDFLRLALAILGERPADVIAFPDPAAFVAPDVAHVASRSDELALARLPPHFALG